MMLTFAFLGLSICAVWAPNIALSSDKSIPPWLLLFLAATISGLVSGVLTLPAIAALTLTAAIAWTAQRLGNRWFQPLLVVVSALLALALALHLIPGFRNPILVAAARLTGDAAPYTLYANFDKGAAGLVLLAFLAQRIQRSDDLRRLTAFTLLASLATSAVVMGAALALQYVRFEPKLPSITLTFLAVNLLFTCVAEEAFFRGLIQERLTRACAGRTYLLWLPIAVSSGLFGLLHAGGGPVLVLLATLGGVGYSLAYAKTRRIEVAVFTHFAVNVVHFLGFTYPSVAR